MRQWRRWSTNEHRELLCNEIEALAADADHVAEPSINRLKEQWQGLGHQGAPADDALWARFQAKRLQHQWHTTVPARHRDENALWQQFRAASDAVFARRDAEYQARGATLRANQESRESICDQVLALAESENVQSRAELERRVSELRTRWNDTQALAVPRQAMTALNQRWRNALTAARSQLAVLHEAERWAGLEHLACRAAYCDDLARALVAGEDPDHDAAGAGWHNLTRTEDEGLAKTIETAFEEVLVACSNADQKDALTKRLASNLRRRESLCLTLEIITQIDSPAALQAERMHRQVERLREHLGESEHESGDDITALLRDWYLACPAAASSALEDCFARVRDALRGQASEARLESAEGSRRIRNECPPAPGMR